LFAKQAIDSQHADCVTLLRLAQYALAERRDFSSDDKSFAEALSQFSFDLNQALAKATPSTGSNNNNNNSHTTTSAAPPPASPR
jgi:hypothetical protein